MAVKAAKRTEAGAPPRYLRAAGRAAYRQLRAEYSIEDAGGLLLLAQVAECMDRLAAARVAIAEHGELVTDRYNAPKLNPALALEKDARAQLLRRSSCWRSTSIRTP